MKKQIILPGWANLVLAVLIVGHYLSPPPDDGVVRCELISMIVISLLMSAASLVISELLREKPEFQNAKLPGDGDFKFPTAVEGRPVPVVIGKVKVAGPNVLWWGDRFDEPIREKIPTGMFSSERVTVGYRYNVGIQMAICTGASGIALRRIWVGDRVIWEGTTTHEQSIEIDEPEWFGGEKSGGGIVGTVTFHDGRDGQAASTYLSTVQTPTPGYTGTCYATFNGYIGTSEKNIAPWAFEVERYPDQLSLTGTNHKIGDDANPAEFLYEILTNDDWGFEYLPADVQTSVFTAVGETLFTEGNGISLVLDREMDASELLTLVQEQIDGLVFIDKSTGLFWVSLARDDYVLGNLPLLDEDNVLAVTDFSRQMWDGTKNQVRIEFADRARDYFGTSAKSDDLGNQRMQGGQIVSLSKKYPGVKSATLANDIAARVLRFYSLPLAKASVRVNREFWDTNPNDVYRFTNTNLGLTDLPMRVIRVDYGTDTDTTITLGLVQDIFSLETGFFSVPPDTLWDGPVQGVGATTADEQIIVEAPRALIDRSDLPERTVRLFAGARRTDGERTFKVYQRNDPTTPSGAYTLDGETAGTMLIGELNVALTAGDAHPTTSVQLNSNVDSIALLNSLIEPQTAGQIGQDLGNLIQIGDEYMAFESASGVTGTTINLDNVYRGLLDSARADHASGDKVYMLYTGMTMSELDLPAGNVVDAQLRGVSRDAEVAEGAALTTQLTLQDRYLRPYPPSRLDIEGTRFDTTISLDNAITGSGLDAFGFDVSWYRRDYALVDEVEALEVDDTTVSSESQQNRIRVLRASDDQELTTTAWAAGTTDEVGRSDVLGRLNGVVTEPVKVNIGTRHTVDAVQREALQELSFTTTPSSTALGSLFSWGTLPANVASSGYTVVDDTVDHDFTIGTALSGNVEYRINSGAWTTLIAASGTTGSIPNASLSASDVIYIRHLDNGGSPTNTLCVCQENGGSNVAYAVLNTEAALDALTGYWDLNETSGDRSRRLGVDRKMDDTNTATSGVGIFGNALHCRNITGPAQEYVRLPNAEAGDILPVTGQSFTMCCWTMLNTIDSTTQVLFSMADIAGGTTGRIAYLSLNSSNDFEGVVYDAAGSAGLGPSTVTAVVPNNKTWYFVALVYSAGSTQYTCHVIPQGSSRSAGSTITIGAGLNAAAANTNVAIGASENGGSATTTDSVKDGLMDEARIYHRALTTGQLESLAAQTSPF